MENLYEQLLQAIQKHADLDTEEIIEAGQHGADAGWSGFIWDHEAAAFFDAHADLIWELLTSMAEEMGYANPMALVATFNRGDMLNRPQGFKVLLAWYALEEVGWYLESRQEVDSCQAHLKQQKLR